MDWKIDEEPKKEKPVRVLIDIFPSEAKALASSMADGGFYSSFPLTTENYVSVERTSALRDNFLSMLRSVAKR